MSARELITEHLDLWTGAVTQKRSAGQGTNGKVELTGIKKLRELILELAVRGKLVEQDPSDEPASVLLKRIAEEKAQLVKEGKIKKPRKLPTASSTEKPFPLPAGWSWTQLEEIGHDWGQKQPDQPFSYIDVSAIDNIKGKIKNPDIINPEDAPSRARKKVKPGTLIYSTVRPYLQNVAVIEGKTSSEPIASTAFSVINPLGGIPARYLLHYLRSPVFIRYVESVQTGIAYPAINDKQFFSGLLPVPPLAAQLRIVEKIDELMALCDRLEQQVGDQLEAHEVLVSTLLDALTRSTDATELAENWARIAEHFDTLFTTEASINKLKKTILQLAVMGRLVPQDPNDEPASVLLDKITEEKVRLVKEGKTKEPKRSDLVHDNEKPFQLPEGWEWCRGEQLADFVDPHPSHRTPPVFEGGVPYVGYTEINHSKGIDFKNARKVDPKVFDEHKERYQLKLGDFVFGKIGTIGEPFFLPEPFNYCLSANLILIQPRSTYVAPTFLASYLESPNFKDFIGENKTNSTHGVFGIKKARQIAVPLPPLAEQHRIVEKVDELMALCDQLTARLCEAGETHTHLAEAVVDQAVS